MLVPVGGGTVAVLAHKRLEQLHNLLLLSAGQLGSCIKKLAEFASGSGSAAWPRLTKKLFDGDAEGLSHWDEHVGTRKVPAGLPIKHVGVLLADLTGKFPDA